ncbi:hypothetical protein [Azomonas macrocytogenes]|uniref:Uncharacterized protein n=1 Tax=Azomonas macrocytogenes TaxID=69962 RepID=A0A839T1V6_AZOMA|nr:hypothetical protein [Azomonas macrocytogenes]MBB3103088.1 hypothetical protein [Azomonas macrocytogenes]
MIAMVASSPKRFSVDFNGAQPTANNLQQAVSAAGSHTTISVFDIVDKYANFMADRYRLAIN